MVERLLTLREVADLLRLPVATLYRQRYVGANPGALGFPVGRYIMYRPTDVVAWMDQSFRDREA